MPDKNRIFADSKNQSFGSIIHTARVRRGMTQRDLADVVGTTVGTISNVELGRSCTMNTMFDLINALEISIEFGIDPPTVDRKPYVVMLASNLHISTPMRGYLARLVTAAVKLRSSKKRELLLSFAEALPFFEATPAAEE